VYKRQAVDEIEEELETTEGQKKVIWVGKEEK